MVETRTLRGKAGLVPVYVYPDEDRLGEALAERILRGIQETAAQGVRYLLGCPTGRSPASTFRALARQAERERADLSRTVLVLMDEYLVPVNGQMALCPDDAHYSCRRFARAEIRDVINAGLPEERRIHDEHIWWPNPEDPGAYEQRVADAGGVNLFIIASGTSDGHVAFNPPGTDRKSRTRIVELADTTRRDNMESFPGFRRLDEVPTHGITIGVDSIVSLSHHVACIIHGEHKQTTVYEVETRKAYDPGWPVSLVYEAPTIGLFLDRAAAGGLCQ